MLATVLLIVLPAFAAAEPNKLAGRTARQSFVEQFNEMAASGDMPFLFRMGKPDTTLSVVTKGGRCTKPLLDKIIELSGEGMRNVGFVRVDCSSDSSVSVRL